MSEIDQPPPVGDALQIAQQELFSTPIWRVAAPEIDPHKTRLIESLEQKWADGYFEKHGHGYGYQSKHDLFSPQAMEAEPVLRTIRDKFVWACRHIVSQRHGIAKQMPFDIYAVQGWYLIQTAEEWVDGPWHCHHPAVLSGCYYLQIPNYADPKEGLLMFERSQPPTDIFVSQQAGVSPVEGQFVIFPSYLMHRPAPCPTADKWRITVAMDCYVHWHKRYAGPVREVGPEQWDSALKESFDPRIAGKKGLG